MQNCVAVIQNKAKDEFKTFSWSTWHLLQGVFAPDSWRGACPWCSVPQML